MQAIILAAGMGKRLKDLTSEATKCMVRVNGISLIERMLSQLDALRLEQIVLVVGFQAKKLVSYISTLDIKTPIIYVENPIYDKTNNIYSLYLASEYLLKQDTLLLESDLIFEDSVMQKIVDDPYPSLALVARFESWMDGTVVTMRDDNSIDQFLDKKHFKFSDISRYYKTVNIYKFSQAFSATKYVPFLEAYCTALGNNVYYEQVLRVITLLDKPEIKALPLNGESWYEIDDIQDLDIAESIFAPTPGESYRRINARYGGFWRYPNLLDFCYLVNPYYPPHQLLDEIKANFETLLTSYPSSEKVNSLLAAKYWGLKPVQIVVGNGAAELIKSILSNSTGNIGITLPTFEEYPNRVDANRVIAFRPQSDDFRYSIQDLMQFFEDKEIRTLVLINPDNPSGNWIELDEVLQLANWAKSKHICLVVDESFSDFVHSDSSSSLLSQEVLKTNQNLVVVKSISKSFGVPGLRLGILASDSTELLTFIKKDIAIWNINAFGEFFLQIFEKYIADYRYALERFYLVRADFQASLTQLGGIRLLPSQANYFMMELVNGKKSSDLAEFLYDKHHILIKDLSKKKGINGQYIRIAIKLPEENEKLFHALAHWL